MRCIEKTLYTNGRIVTMDAAGTVAEAVLVAGNVIEAVGSKDGLAALAGRLDDDFLHTGGTVEEIVAAFAAEHGHGLAGTDDGTTRSG